MVLLTRWTMYEAAKLLETEESIRFLFAGGGSERQRSRA